AGYGRRGRGRRSFSRLGHHVRRRPARQCRRRRQHELKELALTASLTQKYLDVAAKLAPELETLADDIEATEQFPARGFQLLADNDMLRLTLPAKWGGQGMTLMEYFPVLQEIAKIHGTFRMFVHGQNGMWRLVDQWGTDAQKDRWMPVFHAGGI